MQSLSLHGFCTDYDTFQLNYMAHLSNSSLYTTDNILCISLLFLLSFNILARKPEHI